MQRAKKIICALDTSSIDEAQSLVRKLSSHVGAFKIGHALTLVHGLDAVQRLQDAGADRIFLDLKFHDIPNSVAIAVREAARRSVWMTTVHLSGGSAMLAAAMEEARSADQPTLIMGVSVLTSIDERMLTTELGIGRSVAEQMLLLSHLADATDLDGVISSPHEVSPLRAALGPGRVIAVPGIRPAGTAHHDQKRVGSARQALDDGADYLVIGRALTGAEEPATVIEALELNVPA